MQVPKDRRRLLYISIYIAIFIISITVRINVARKHRFPSGDEGPWLYHAAAFPTKDFMQSRVIEHDNHPYKTLPHPEDNRSPLFPIMIACFGLISNDMFIAGQVCVLFIFTLFFFYVSWFTLMKSGVTASLITTACVGLSPHFIQFSAYIYPDLCLTFGFLFLLAIAPKIYKTKLMSISSGLLLGLMFLLKTTALFLVPVYIFFSWKQRKEEHILQNTIIFFACTGIVAAPWLLRNMMIFHSPLYQIAKEVLVLEKFHDIYIYGNKLPTLTEYITSKGIFFFLVQRPVLGFLNTLRVFSQFDNGLSLIILPLSCIGLYIFQKKRKIPVQVVIFSLFYIPFMSYIAYASWVYRFIFIYYLFLYWLAGIGAEELIKIFSRRLKIYSVFFSCIVVALIMTRTLYPLESFISSRGSEVEHDTYAREIISVIEKKVKKSETVLSPFLFQYNFMHKINVLNVLTFENPTQIETYLRQYNGKYTLLDIRHGNGLVNLLKGLPSISLRLLEKKGTFMFYKIMMK